MAHCSWHACWRRRSALVAVAAGLGLTPARARASDEEGPVALEWVAPEGCPDAAHVEREVERLLAGMSASGGPYLQARAEVRQNESGLWHVELRTTGRQGAGLRTVTAESCRALADATALILALAIDPALVATSGEPESSGPTPSTPPAPRDAVPTPTSTRPPTPTSPRAVRFAATASAMVDIGTLPTTTPGGAARLAVMSGALPALRLEIGAGLFADVAATGPPTRSGTFSLRTFDAGACALTRAGRLEVGACANGEIAWLSAAGLYESTTSRGNAEWVVLRARATAAYLWSSMWAVRADVGAGVNMSQPEFVSTGADQGLIHQPARYTGRGALGIELRF